jgi:AcrB/AcrD/AcrF family
MTSLAFVLGLAPLVFATGVASLTRRGIGTAVFGGMIAATLVGVFAIPLLYIVFERARTWRWRRAPERTQRERSVSAVPCLGASSAGGS